MTSLLAEAIPTSSDITRIRLYCRYHIEQRRPIWKPALYISLGCSGGKGSMHVGHCGSSMHAPRDLVLIPRYIEMMLRCATLQAPSRYRSLYTLSHRFSLHHDLLNSAIRGGRGGLA